MGSMTNVDEKSMKAKVIFVRSSKLPDGAKAILGYWLKGDSNTRLLLLEDCALNGNALLNNIKETQEVAYRLHNSQEDGIKQSQRDVIKNINPEAKELAGFSHVDGNPIYQAIIQIVENETERNKNVLRLVNSDSAAAKYALIDEYAVRKQLGDLSKDKTHRDASKKVKSRLEEMFGNDESYLPVDAAIQQGDEVFENLRSLASKINGEVVIQEKFQERTNAIDDLGKYLNDIAGEEWRNSGGAIAFIESPVPASNEEAYKIVRSNDQIMDAPVLVIGLDDKDYQGTCIIGSAEYSYLPLGFDKKSFGEAIGACLEKSGGQGNRLIFKRNRDEIRKMISKILHWLERKREFECARLKNYIETKEVEWKPVPLSEGNQRQINELLGMLNSNPYEGNDIKVHVSDMSELSVQYNDEAIKVCQLISEVSKTCTKDDLVSKYQNAHKKLCALHEIFKALSARTEQEGIGNV